MPIKPRHETDGNAALIRARIAYDPETGAIVWRDGVRAGKPAGGVRLCHGYIALAINGRKSPNFLAHRIAWLLMTGGWPAAQIDHINRSRADNRWVNLREASPAEQKQNSSYRKNRFGLQGVALRKRGKPYEARICVNYKRIGLGAFNTPAEAHAAYLVAKAHYHPFSQTEAGQ